MACVRMSRGARIADSARSSSDRAGIAQYVNQPKRLPHEPGQQCVKPGIAQQDASRYSSRSAPTTDCLEMYQQASAIQLPLGHIPSQLLDCPADAQSQA